jgi:uncharacterized protein YciI
MIFALICTDKPNSLDIRTQVRGEHLKFLENLGAGLKAAGPFTDDAGNMNGSLVVIDAPNLAEARAISDRDPYAKAGLFASVDIRPWNWRIKNPEAP